jgi:hypothetical protein
MSAQKISQFPAITAVGLSDELLVNQTVLGVPTTFKSTVRQLIGCVMPSPEITALTWNSGPKTLDVECDNILPNSIISVDGIYYAITTFVRTAGINYKATVSIPAGLIAGDHEVIVSNMFINESSSNITV